MRRHAATDRKAEEAKAALLEIFKSEQIEIATRKANEDIRREQQMYLDGNTTQDDVQAVMNDIKDTREAQLRDQIEAINALTSIPHDEDEDADESYEESKKEDEEVEEEEQEELSDSGVNLDDTGTAVDSEKAKTKGSKKGTGGGKGGNKGKTTQAKVARLMDMSYDAQFLFVSIVLSYCGHARGS
jgi:hypothetical protein